ncbi:MAG: efflux RND transporter periplasmic adaptor subunit [Betaproteobacteria bacterium]|nr:efflux RND transporter periplasmic adaptor subunit [Betaproteobacteria bacterium]
MNKPRTAIALAAVAVIAAVVLFNARPKPVAVDLLELAATDVQTSVVASGRVLPPAKVEVGATITGRVERVPVREGARVKAGEVLVELERAELAAAAAQARAAAARARARVASVRTLALPTAQAGLQQAEANLRLAEQEERRNRELLAKGFISQARLDEAVRQLEVSRSVLASARANAGAQAAEGAEAQQAQSQLAEAEAALATAEARLAQTRIRAPGDGVVLERLIEPGDIVQPGRRLISLALDGAVRLVVQVDEKNLPLIRQGAVAVAAADAFPNERFEAVVSYISAGVDPARGSVELRFDVAKPPPALRADMTVSIDLPGPLLKQALMLPADAVRQLQTDAPWVLVDREGKAVRTAVKAGLQTQGRVAIAEGLKARDRVVLNREVEDGTRIRARR